MLLLKGKHVSTFPITGLPITGRVETSRNVYGKRTVLAPCTWRPPASPSLSLSLSVSLSLWPWGCVVLLCLLRPPPTALSCVSSSPAAGRAVPGQCPPKENAKLGKREREREREREGVKGTKTTPHVVFPNNLFFHHLLASKYPAPTPFPAF